MRIRHLGSERGDIEYVYDGQSILDELHNNSTSLVAHYRYGDRLLSLNSNGTDQFYHYASLGTTANLTNAQGEAQVAYRTDPFGEITQQEGESVNRHIFTGQEHDEKTGLIYFGSRFYDPDTARFINQDTYLGESTTPPSLHRYLYAYANPTVYVDPDGHAPLLPELTQHLLEHSADISQRSSELRKQGNHLGATAWGVLGSAPLSIAAAATDGLNTALDIQTAPAAYIDQWMGRTSHSVNQDARANVEAKFSGYRTLAGKFTSRDGLSELGTPMVEAFAGMYKGDADSWQKLANFSGEMLLGSTLLKGPKLDSDQPQSTTKARLTKEQANLDNGGAQGTVNQGNSVGAQSGVPDSQVTSAWSKNSSDARYVLRDIESYTDLPIPKNQRAELVKHLKENDHTFAVSKTEYEAVKKEYNKLRTQLRNEWEINTGQVWPTTDKGVPYQAHHIITERYGGPNTWWNIHPARFPDQHQGGIHRANGATSQVFPLNPVREQ